MLQTGIKGRKTMTVTEDDTAEAAGSGVLRVFATPKMIALIEATASESVSEYLEEGTSTVGTRIDVTHSAPSPVGSVIVCDTTLIEIDRRRLVFSVTARDGAGEIGSGIHERFVVGNARFMEKAESRLADS